MKKKNGFISISIIYSFFLVFLMLLLFIVNNLVNNRVMLNNVRNQVKNDISDTNFKRYLVNHNEDLNLIRHDGSTHYSASDNSYRYAGANPNNYLCFHSGCSDNEKYRIIGVINDRVKIIKYTGIDKTSYDTNLNSIYVNTAMYNSLKNYAISLGELTNKFETSTFYVGGIEEKFKTEKIYIISNYEIGVNKNNGVFVEEIIGLPYISDYAYAKAYTSNSYSQAVTGSQNWMLSDEVKNNGGMWLMTRETTRFNYVFYIDNTGILQCGPVSDLRLVRPVFYLKNSIRILGGAGTHANPYIVS